MHSPEAEYTENWRELRLILSPCSVRNEFPKGKIAQSFLTMSLKMQFEILFVKEKKIF